MEREEIAVDFHKICRLCLTEEPQMTSIFMEQFNTVPLPLRIMACASIEIAAADLLPSQICNTCLHQVDNWYKFKEICENTDAALRRLVANEAITFEEIAEIQENGRQLKRKFTTINSEELKHNAEENKTDNQRNDKSGEGRQDEESKRRMGRETCGNGVKKEKALEALAYHYVEQLQLSDDSYESNDSESHTAEQLMSDNDYSSDDSLTLLAHKEKLLKERQSRRRGKPGKVTVEAKRVLRTMQTQTGDDETDSAVEISVTEMISEGRKKQRNKRTQTLEEKSKKRFRIRPAVPSACTLCEKIYKNGEILRQHMKSHHVSGNIECHQCKATFSSLRSLKYHEQRNHGNLEPVPCSFCGKEFLDKKYLRIHENIHSKANQYVCQFCGRKFIMKTNLTVHISRHHTQKTNDFICQVCGKAFPFKLYLKKHFKTHTDYKPHKCSFCDACFRESTLLRKHINSIHLKLRPFQCEYCQKTFTRSLYLREHMESQHLGIPRKVDCDRCGEAFSTRTKLRQHDCKENLQLLTLNLVEFEVKESESSNIWQPQESIVEEETDKGLSPVKKKRKLNFVDITYDQPVPSKDGKVHQCRVCFKFLKNVTTRNRHEVERHPPPLICDICGKSLSTVLSYNTHRKVHLGLTQYKCQFCNKFMASKSNLLDHEKVHTKERNVPCPKCEKSFSSISNLRVHLKFHSGVKTYFCDVCGMGHVTPGNLQLHVKRHKNERNHICEKCGKGFIGKYELNKHIQSHNQEKNFSCGYCFQKMKTSNSLRRHVNIQHLKLKPYKCGVCEREFGRRENFKEHMQLHIKKEFLCPVCTKEFTHPRYLKKHKCES